MRIAFLSSYKLSNLNNRLQGLFDIYNFVSKKHEVVWIGYKLFCEVYNHVHSDMNEMFVAPKVYSLLFGKLLSDRLKNYYFDLIICQEPLLCAYLNTDIPVIYIGDVRGRSGSCIKMNDADYNFLERLSVQKADRVIHHADWIKGKTLKEIQGLRNKFNMIKLGDNINMDIEIGLHNILDRLFNEKNDVYIPVYVINMKNRPERKEHIIREFKGKNEFNINIVEACTHEKGTIGLWNSIVKIVNHAQMNGDDVIILCEDDHFFTEHYSAGLLMKEIKEAYMQQADILSGGIGGFGHAIPVGYHRYWVDWLWCTQFVVVYKRFFNAILSYNFKDTDTADGVFSELSTNKMVIYPFISEQTDFGYSDVTQNNQKNKGLIREHFDRANRHFFMIQAVYGTLKRNSAEL